VTDRPVRLGSGEVESTDRQDDGERQHAYRHHHTMRCHPVYIGTLDAVHYVTREMSILGDIGPRT
jgi:hypothetical protein